MKTSAILAAILAASSLDAAVIEQVIVRQQWPWSTDVKVEYKISGVTSPVNVAVRAFNANEELDSSNLEASITGERFGITKDGVGQFIIDPVKAFGTASVALANFKVKLSLVPAAENINEVIYKVFDLSTGKCQDITRADFYNGNVEDGDFVTSFQSIDSGFSTSLDDVFIWTGVTNNVKYKTTHLVMRKVPAASYGVWTMGSPESETFYKGKPEYRTRETNHLVRLTRDYYIGVFEVTQKQYYLLTGKNTAVDEDKARDDADVLPETYLMYGGYTSYTTALGFVGKLRAKTGCSGFDVPTEAQWEFACRAGTDTALNCGHNIEPTALWSSSDVWANKVAIYSATSSGSIQPVGKMAPNAFGLYDMHGNAYEWCSDFYSDGDAYIASFGSGWTPETVVVDPTGPSSTSQNKVLRSGRFTDTAVGIRSALRGGGGMWTTPNRSYGMRVMLAVED